MVAVIIVVICVIMIVVTMVVIIVVSMIERNKHKLWLLSVVGKQTKTMDLVC